MTLQQDSKQNIWIGTYSEGLCCFNKQSNTFVTYKKSSHPDSLSDNSDLMPKLKKLPLSGMQPV
ncbi:hypothetical protein [Bacteroides finegoldii]|uniref:hypothetical protein n=1 Tax=Bacteroides finegoldii TaxID=338188 RepID=UPI0022DF8F96|nr:hypothetical protein [Bacteroides finegoldii]